MSLLRWSARAAVTETYAGTVVRSDLVAFHVVGRDAAALVREVLPLFDGTRDLPAIVSALGAYSPKSVIAVVRALVARGLVEEALPAASPALAETRIRCVGSEPFVGVVMDALAGAGARDVARLRGREIQGTSLLVAGFAPGEGEAMFEAARLAHEGGVASLWAEVAGRRAVIGPLVDPGATACRVCAATEAVNPRDARERAEGRARVATSELVGEIVAAAVISVIAGDRPTRLAGRTLTQDLATREAWWRTLVRLPWCPVCG